MEISQARFAGGRARPRTIPGGIGGAAYETSPLGFGEEVLARIASTGATEPRVALGLNLDVMTGYAYALVPPGRVLDPAVDFLASGQWDLSAGSYESGAIAFVKLRHFLAALRPELVFYADPGGPPPARPAPFDSTSAKSAAVYRATLTWTVADWASQHGVPCRAVPIGTIKRRGTGRGVARKSDLVPAANALLGLALDPAQAELTGVDRVADAALGLLVGLEEHVREARS